MLLLPQTLTVREARDALRMLSQALRREKDGPVTLDGVGLQQFDSAALAVLIDCRRQAESFGRAFEVRNLPPKLEALARLYGVDELLGERPVSTAVIPAVEPTAVPPAPQASGA